MFVMKLDPAWVMEFKSIKTLLSVGLIYSGESCHPASPWPLDTLVSPRCMTSSHLLNTLMLPFLFSSDSEKMTWKLFLPVNRPGGVQMEVRSGLAWSMRLITRPVIYCCYLNRLSGGVKTNLWAPGLLGVG